MQQSIKLINYVKAMWLILQKKPDNYVVGKVLDIRYLCKK